MSSTDNSSPPPPPLPPETYANTNTPNQPHGKKKRIRNWTADDRAAHRVFERSRREAFKERLTSLAHLVPALGTTDPSRLSKHVVIDESIALHEEQQRKIARSAQEMDMVVAERDELLAELNTWRAGAGLEARQPGFLPGSVRGEQDSADPPPRLEGGDGVGGVGGVGGVTDETWVNGPSARDAELLDTGQDSLVAGGTSADALMRPDAHLGHAIPAEFMDMPWPISSPPSPLHPPPVTNFGPLDPLDIGLDLLPGMISTKSREPPTELMSMYGATGGQCHGGNMSYFDIDREPVMMMMMDPLSLSDNPSFIRR